MRGKRPAKKPRECLLPGCNKKLSRQFHFCKGHEALVPAVLLNAVNKTHALYLRHLDFNTTKNELHRKQWQLARGVAIVAVQHRLGQITQEQLAGAIAELAPSAPPFEFEKPKENPNVNTDPQSGEMIKIGPDVEVTVVAVNGGQVRIGVTAPKTVAIDREEIADRKRRERQGLPA